MRLVKITWVDSFGVGQNWQPLINATDTDTYHECISVGFLAKDGKNVKVIVPHYSPANDENGAEEQGCGDMAIPCRAIVEMVDLTAVETEPLFMTDICKWNKISKQDRHISIPYCIVRNKEHNLLGFGSFIYHQGKGCEWVTEPAFDDHVDEYL